uniref:RING-type domain-containing protein n=1 Tax=Syphacia muris TaxID=451379 RepID=A0A0N5AH98_9BILA
MPRLSGRCPICLGEFIQEEISALRCGHTFHYLCISQWLKTSKTCPECRSVATEHNIIRQLFFSSGDITQSVDDFSSSEEAACRRVAELKQELAAEQRAHSKTVEKLRKVEKQRDSAEASCLLQKKKVKNLTTQVARMQQLELMLADQQELERKLERYRARLRATKFNDFGAGDAKIDKFLDSNCDPDIQKFLDLMKKQYESVKRRLHDMEAQMEATQRSNLELRMKLDKHKRLNVAFKEELSGLSADNSHVLINPRLSEVIACSPRSPRRSFGFDLSDEDDVFSKSLMQSALRTSSRPVLRPVVKQDHTKEHSLSPLLENDSFAGPSFSDLLTCLPSSTEKETDVEMSSDDSCKWEVKFVKPIPSVTRYLPKEKKKVKSGKKLCNSGYRNKGVSPLLMSKTARNRRDTHRTRVADFFTTSSSTNVETELDESVIFLD